MIFRRNLFLALRKRFLSVAAWRFLKGKIRDISMNWHANLFSWEAPSRRLFLYNISHRLRNEMLKSSERDCGNTCF